MTSKRRQAPTDPRVEGGRYLCGYWRQEYTVEKIEQTGPGVYGRRYTVRWADGHVTTHSTAWEKRDRVIAQPGQ